MGAENLLFPEMKAGPPGFIYRENFVTEEEEKTLAASLGQLDLKPFEFHGYLGNRRVASFGLKYDYERRSVEPASAMPEFLDDLLARVAEFAGCEPEAFRQVGVNEYRPGGGNWVAQGQAAVWDRRRSIAARVGDDAAQAGRGQAMGTSLSYRAASLGLRPLRRGPVSMGTQHSPGERPAIFDYLSDVSGVN
jgi:hypothetical protein